MGESSIHNRLFCRHQHSGSGHSYSETRCISKFKCLKGAYSHTELEDTDMIKPSFCCKIWVYSLRITLFGWYLWPKMAYKMSQEFPTITSYSRPNTFPHPSCRRFAMPQHLPSTSSHHGQWNIGFSFANVAYIFRTSSSIGLVTPSSFLPHRSWCDG